MTTTDEQTSTDQLVAKDAALIVVDMQNSCLADEGSMAKVGLDISDLKETVAPVQRLIAASRAAGIPIVFSQYEFRPDYSDGGLLVELYPALREVGGMVAGTWDAAFDSRLTVEPSDIVISKSRYSAFFGTELEQVLRQRGVRTLIICGVTTEMCVESTLRDGFFRDFRIVLAADAVASVDRARHQATLQTVEYGFGAVTPTTDIIAALEQVPK